MGVSQTLEASDVVELGGDLDSDDRSAADEALIGEQVESLS